MSADEQKKTTPVPKTQPAKGATQSAAEFYHRVNIEECLYTDNFEVTDACISCGTCEGECPVGAISMGSDHFQVNEDTCIDCGACESACPVGAISEK